MPTHRPISNMSCKPRTLNKFASFLSVSLGGAITFGVICTYRGDEYFYRKALMPMVTKFVHPEIAHEACLLFTKYRLIRCQDKLKAEQSQKLKTNVFNLEFENPIGIAAGFDKNSQAVSGLGYYGLGFAEVGTVTPQPQDGNPKPRIFRISEKSALINRCGFNNEGIDHVVGRLSKFETFKPMLVGLNLGKNKNTDHISSDYLIGLEKSRSLQTIDYLVINISSPNTPGLRDFQQRANLETLLDDIFSKMNSLSIQKPLLVKVAPDLSDDQIKDIAEVVITKKSGNAKVSGIILTNTTISRPNSTSDKIPVYEERGGLSGLPLRDMSTKVISKFYQHTKGQLPIIGVGGVFTGQDAYDKIKAGASLIQLYTGITYEGPPIVNKIKRELIELLDRDGLSSITDAVGLDHRNKTKT